MANMNFISQFLANVLSFIDGIVGNYGLSVIVFTLVVRMILLPLDIKSKKSMKAMQRIQPQMDYLNKKYAQDKERLNQKMSELYRKEHVSPLSGCLPMLFQLPILFCMFTAMRVVANEKTVEMILGMMNGVEPQFEGFLWITNVFQPDAFWSSIIPTSSSALSTLQAVTGSQWLTIENVDTVRAFLDSAEYAENWAAMYGANEVLYQAPLLLWTITVLVHHNGLFILPVVSGLSQLLATKLTPQTTPTTQTEQQKSNNKIMQYMFPLISLWICSSSTSAFSIYWVFSNVIQIVQTLAINFWMDRKEKASQAKIEGVN